MKIVCDACQAKYSIADEKIQGKAFKIRCKKCNHIIVVRVGADGASGASADRPRTTGSQAVSGAAGGDRQRISASHAAASAAATASAGDQAVWHVVVDGEQVGPLTESEVKDRLKLGKVNSDTLVWKEGFGDWTQFSAVPELTPLLAKITRQPVAAKPRTTGQIKAVVAPVAADAAEADPFAAPTVVTPAGTAELFAASVAPGAATPQVSPMPTSPFLFGGGPAQPIEPVAPRSSGGNGASTTHLTGQRNENSVLFSLANLEALAVPSASNVRSPSTTSNTEGSGLIDIRSMAAMTLGDGPTGGGRSADALPTFSTPQFSPVAPVILPLSTSGPPKWVYPVLILLGIAMLAVGVSIYKVAVAPPPGLPPAPPPAPAPAPAAAPAAAAPTPATPGGAAPAPAEAAKPAGGEKPAPGAATEAGDRAKGSSGKSDKPRITKKSGEGGSGKGGSEKKGDTGLGASGSAEPGKAGRKGPGSGGRTIDDMINEVGTKKAAAPEEPPKPVVKLITLTNSEIITAMKGVQPKIQNCANQYKQPGTAMATITVASGGRVTGATVTGKFAGTPTGSCVEAAAKTAKFPPCQPMTFPWPFTLMPR